MAPASARRTRRPLSRSATLSAAYRSVGKLWISVRITCRPGLRQGPEQQFQQIDGGRIGGDDFAGRAPIGIGFLNHLFLWPEPYRRTERDVKSFFVLDVVATQFCQGGRMTRGNQRVQTDR